MLQQYLHCLSEPLKASGAEGLLLASGTMHRVEGAVASEACLPVLHIADAAADGRPERELVHVRAGVDRRRAPGVRGHDRGCRRRAP